MLCIDRSQLIPNLHKMVKQGGFWGRIAEAAMYADQTNLEILITAFPKLIEGQALEKAQWMPQSSTSRTAKTANLKLVWNS